MTHVTRSLHTDVGGHWKQPLCKAGLGKSRPSRLASAAAQSGSGIWGVSTTNKHVHMSAARHYGESTLWVALAAHVRSGTCRAMLPRAPDDALLDSVLNPTQR